MPAKYVCVCVCVESVCVTCNMLLLSAKMLIKLLIKKVQVFPSLSALRQRRLQLKKKTHPLTQSHTLSHTHTDTDTRTLQDEAGAELIKPTATPTPTSLSLPA